jgi:hypothetical protein
MSLPAAGDTDNTTAGAEAGARWSAAIRWASAVVGSYEAGVYPMNAANRPVIMLGFAISYAAAGWEVFPLGARKAPRIKSPHPKGFRCKGRIDGCLLDGHGLNDGSVDIRTIVRWWGLEYRGANIGGRVPKGVLVLDFDPRKPGHAVAVSVLTQTYGPLPLTLTTISGRGDGGCHYFYRRPPGRLSLVQLGTEFSVAADPGIDIKDRGGLIVLPPSIHHVTGNPYTAVDNAIAALPLELGKKMTVKPAPPRPATTTRRHVPGQQSPTAFNNATTWRDVLGPHGWTCRSSDPDADGAVWLHPLATSDCSATIRGGRLYVYSTSTAFDATSTGDRHGYSKFDAHQLLNGTPWCTT